jgi:uncharacterized protein YacL
LNQTKLVLFYLALSVIGAALLVGLALQTPTSHPLSMFPGKISIAAVFILCCIFGISFSLRPNWVRLFIRKKEEMITNHSNAEQRSFQGHHPDCETFKNHRWTYQNKTWCAGCFGLLIGCLLSSILMILYVVVPLHLSPMISHLLLITGFIIIVVVYLEIIQKRRHASIHVLSNGMLVLSFFFIMVSIIELSGKVEYGLYTILLCMLWLDTRVQLSRWYHSRLCRSCLQSCKTYIAMIIYGR